MMKTIDLLPAELMIIIFRFLDFSTHLKIRRVSKHWSELVDKLMSDNKRILIHDTDKALREICDYNSPETKYCNKITSISLKRFKAFDSRNAVDFMPRIISNCTQLKSIYLNFSDVFKSQSNVLDIIINSCSTDLRHVSFIGIKTIFIRKAQAIKFCEKFSNLTVFQLAATEVKMESCVTLVFRLLLPKLGLLIVMDGKHSSESHISIKNSNKDMKFTKNFFNVNETNRLVKVIGQSVGLSEVKALVDKNPNYLCNLHMCGFDCIQAIEMIENHFSGLNSLSIYNSYKLLTEREGQVLMKGIAKLTQLKTLHIDIESDSCIFTYQSLSKLSYCPLLKWIEFESTLLDRDCIESVCIFCPQLLTVRLLDVQFSHNSDYCITSLRSLSYLQRLVLSSNPPLSDTSLTDILHSCRSLKFLDISRCVLMAANTYQDCMTSVKNHNKKMFVCFSYLHESLIQSIHELADNQGQLKLAFPNFNSNIP